MKVSPSCRYFSAGQKPPGFSCRAFNHISPLSLPLYLTAAGVYFCRKQAEHFTATNISNASARTQLRAQCQDCIPRLLICIWPQITQAAWQDLKAPERWGFMHPAALHQHPALYQCTHRGKIHGIHAAVGFQVQGKNPLLCLIYFGLPCSDPGYPKALFLFVTSSWSSCIYKCSPHCLKQEQTHRYLTFWKAAWVMFRRREAGGLAQAVSWHTETRDREFWPLQRKVRVDSQWQQSSGDKDSELSLIKPEPLKLRTRKQGKAGGTEDPEAEMVTSLLEVTSFLYSHKYLCYGTKMGRWLLQLFQRKRRSDREHMGFWSPFHKFSPWEISRQEQAVQKDVGNGWWVAIPERTWSENTSLFLELVLKLWLLLVWPQVYLWVPLTQLWLPSPTPLMSLELTQIYLKSSCWAEASRCTMRQESLWYRVTLNSRFKKKIELSREPELEPLIPLRVWEGAGKSGLRHKLFPQYSNDVSSLRI